MSKTRMTGEGSARGHDEPEASGVRRKALARLLQAEREGGRLTSERKDETGEGRYRHRTLEYVAGVTRMRRRLDHLLAHYYHGEYADMEPALKVILRMGLYDLLFLNTPSYAAVHDAVLLAGREVRPGAGRLVNGLLRRMLRERDRLPEPDSGDEARDLAVRHSHPDWMVRRWLRRHDRETVQGLLAWNNARPVFCVRINTLRIGTDAFLRRLDTLNIRWAPGAVRPYVIRMQSIRPLLEHGLLQAGLCAVQDESAASIVVLLDPRPGERIVDVCAAPGGKALHAAQRMENRGCVVAVDRHRERLRLVEESARSQGAGIVETVVSDARAFDGAWRHTADRVLVDAPCSGLGVLAKRADLRWRRKPEDIADLVQLQDRILDAAAGLVRPGGTLVYGTCTIEPEENEERVVGFLERHTEFEVVDARRHLPERFVTPEGFFASFSPRDGMDGAFGARLRRMG